MDEDVGNKVVGESRNNVGFRPEPSPGVVTVVVDEEDEREMVEQEAALVGEVVEKTAGEISSRKLLPLRRTEE